MKWCMGFALAIVACADEKQDTDVTTDTNSDADTDVDADSDADTDTDVMPSIEIAGDYTDNFGTEHNISDTEWAIAYPGYSADVYRLAEVDNDLDYAVAENAADNAFNSGLWSRFDWFDDGATLWYCQTAYDAADQAAASGTPRADASDPASAGCGGFSWTNLTP